MEEVTRVPPGWLLESAEPDLHIKISVDYGPVSEGLDKTAMWDLTTIHRCGLFPRFQDALDEFLSQFEDINQRWESYYGSRSEDILSAAARLQIDILHDSDTTMDFSSETTVLALALHCRVIVRIFTIIDTESSEFTEDELFGFGPSVIFSELRYKDDMFLPSVAASRHEDIKLPGGNQPPGYQHDGSLGAMLDHIIYLSFRLLDTRDPRHWPTVQYVLLILYMILRRLRPWAPWMEAIKDAADELLSPILQDLARYYYICTDGGQILTTRWNEEDYITRVGGYQWAVEHARFLNCLWVEISTLRHNRIGKLECLTLIDGRSDSSTGDRGIDDFPSKVDDFAHCCDF